MTDDRELLELAAKAAGIKIDKSETNGGGRGNTGFDMLGNAVLDWHNNIRWNPLTDDGDALRLAVKLGMLDSGSGFARYLSEYQRAVGHVPKEETYAATRRAIVRAAAEIGRNMK